ncbi:hypothetical protein DXG01_013382 [Tephrocybe rancida]|nr:hypothetical protein DXG01_013382 [Tephrocybe rancida]
MSSSSHSSHYTSESSCVEYTDTKYCTICDEYFFTKEELLEHIQLSERHPRCEKCNRGFLNKNSLRRHYAFSSSHIYCSVCDKNFKSVAALNVHLEHSIRHSDDSDDDDEDAVDDRPEGWEEELAETLDKEERARQKEEAFTVDSAEEGRLTGVQRRKAMLLHGSSEARSSNRGTLVLLPRMPFLSEDSWGHALWAPILHVVSTDRFSSSASES